MAEKFKIKKGTLATATKYCLTLITISTPK